MVKVFVYRDASLGLGRARMTLAHELGHAIMHDGVKMARRSLVTRFMVDRTLQSAEHQAKVFAAALLIHAKIAENFNSDEELSVEFEVSIEAARVYFDQRRASLSGAKWVPTARVRERVCGVSFSIADVT